MDIAEAIEVTAPAKKPEIISLLEDDDDDDDDAVVQVAAAAAAKRRRHPEVIDLLDTKPAARKSHNDDDLDRKPAAKKRPRFSAGDEVIILDGPPHRQDNRKAPPVASLPAGILEISEPKAKAPLMQVLELFPDVDVEHVKKLLREQDGKVEVVASILVAEPYPKQKSSGADGENAPSLVQRSSSVVVERLRESPKYDYSSTNSFEPSSVYMEEAIQQLMFDFSFLKTNALRWIFRKNHKRYTLARRVIQDVIVGKVKTLNIGVKPAADSAEKQGKSPPRNAAAQKPADEKEENQHYQTLKAALIRGHVGDEAVKRIGQAFCIKRPRKKIGAERPAVSDDILKDEIHHFEINLKEWTDNIQNRLRKEAARKFSIENGSAISCACCFDDVARSECVPCKEKGHMFCSDCIQQYVETQVFANGNLGIDRRTKKPATEILCCSGDCTSGFRDEQLKKNLPTKTWEKYCELQHIAVAQQAGLGDAMSECSKCGFKAYVPETQILFECPVKDCLFISCKRCGKEPHIPLRCEEVKQKKRQDEGRLKIEEALSAAKMRECPKCKKKFIKEHGCNKMVCPCGLKLCYICRSPLDNKNPYNHFCQTPHCTHEDCGRCKLHSNTEEDDEQAMREAGITAAERYKAELEKEDDGKQAAAGVDLDVDKIMHDPGARTRSQLSVHANAAQVQAAAADLAMQAVEFRAAVEAAGQAAQAQLEAARAQLRAASNANRNRVPRQAAADAAGLANRAAPLQATGVLAAGRRMRDPRDANVRQQLARLNATRRR